MNGSLVHRPRNLDWKRAAALLYGDWGTSKAYVIGLAFVVAGYSSLWILLAVSALTAVVGYNYIVVCKHFPDGGGVYSAARPQSRLLAVTGALLLVANFTVTAALSGWAAMFYLGLPPAAVRWGTLLMIVVIGLLNYLGPKHTGSVAISLALPMVVAVLATIILSLPHLTLENLEPPHAPWLKNWVGFTGVILALSGVEAVANLTGVMRLDPEANPDNPRVAHTARRTIIPVAVEVVLGTVLLGWAMLSLPRDLAPQLEQRWEDMVRVLAEQYGTLAFGPEFGRGFGFVVGLVIGLLLLSAVNTAIGALIGLVYMMARDGEMPRTFTRLNRFGVPWWPLGIAIVLPALVTLFAGDLVSLAGLYAIGVVGAITVNLGSCAFNRRLPLKGHERGIMTITFLVLLAVEVTIAKTKPDALFFALCVLGSGLALRTYAQRRAGLRSVTVHAETAAAASPESLAAFQPQIQPGQSILVAVRGLTPVLRFASEEARLRQANLYVLYVKELAVSLPARLEMPERPRWQDDPEAAQIMLPMLELGKQNQVNVIPLYAISDNPAHTILDLAATMGIDLLMLGSPHRGRLVKLLKGNVVAEVAQNLPPNIQLLIYG